MSSASAVDDVVVAVDAVDAHDDVVERVHDGNEIVTAARCNPLDNDHILEL